MFAEVIELSDNTCWKEALCSVWDFYIGLC